MSFSAYLTLSKVVNYFTKQGDVFLLSLFSSSAMVGIYSRGYQLTTSTLQLINGSIIKVFYPVIAAKRFDPKLMWNITSLAVTALSIVYSFLFWIIYYYADVIVLFLLGKDWILVADLLPIFCIIAFMLGMASVFSQILKALGRGDLMLKITLACSSITLGFFYIGVHFGIIGLAFGYMFGSLVLYLTVLLICGILLGSSIIRVLGINLLCVLLFFLISSFSKLIMEKVEFTSHLFSLGSFLILYLFISVVCLSSLYKRFDNFFNLLDIKYILPDKN
jgi:O-antigen/teichoic acid export membrane protein